MISKGSPLLPVIEVSASKGQVEQIPLSRHARKKKYMAVSEERWQKNPQQYLPYKHAQDTIRIERMWALLSPHLHEKQKIDIVDLGCGASPLSSFVPEAHWTYVDSSLTALSFLSLGKKSHDALPLTKLDDDQFDLVICTDVIAELFSQDYRLSIGEIARLVKKEGCALISTAIDIRSEDALARFMALIETEFYVVDSCKSYHRMAIFWLDVLKAPGRWNRQKASPAWKWLSRVLQPCIDKIKKNKTLILFLEKTSLFLWDQEAVSHIAVVVKRKPLFAETATKGT